MAPNRHCSGSGIGTLWCLVEDEAAKGRLGTAAELESHGAQWKERRRKGRCMFCMV